MNDLQVLLQEYLVLNKKLSLPDIGTLSVNYSSAYFDRETRTLHPYRYEVAMTQEEDELNQNNLYLFLKNKFYHQESLSKQSLKNFVSQMMASIQTNMFVWNHVGTFKRGENDKVIFEPDSAIFEKITKSYQIPTRVVVKQKEKSHSARAMQKNIEEIVSSALAVEKNQDVVVEEAASITNQPNEVLGTSQAYRKYIVDAPHGNIHKPQMFVNDNKSQSIRTDLFLDTELTERYSAFQKISIIVVLVVTVLYLFFHLFLNDFSFHSYSN